jgi:cell division protein FtsB
VKLVGKRLMLLALFIVMSALASGVWNIAGKARESAALKHQAQAQLADLTKRQDQLTSDIDSLKTDRGKEEALRKQYALAAKGEHMIVIVDPSVQTAAAATSTPGDWFKGLFGWW